LTLCRRRTVQTCRLLDRHRAGVRVLVLWPVGVEGVGSAQAACSGGVQQEPPVSAGSRGLRGGQVFANAFVVRERVPAHCCIETTHNEQHIAPVVRLVRARRYRLVEIPDLLIVRLLR
jgi:hypothetical protein